MASSSQRAVECPICGNSDYSVIDGLYYCTLCQTQSQNVVEIDFGDIFGEATPYSTVLIKTKRKSQPKVRKAKEPKSQEPQPAEVPVVVELPPNAIYEVYAILFDRFGSALVRLGLPESVKEALLRLYALYLRRRKVAFLDHESDNTETPSESSRLRFLVEKKKRTPIVKPKKVPRGEIKLELDDYDQNEQLPNVPDDAYLDFLGGLPAAEDVETPAAPANRRRQTGAEESSSVSAPNSRKRPIEEVITIEDDEVPEQPEDPEAEYAENLLWSTRIQPNLVIPFCYLACLATCPQSICISDLVRWIRENLLPVVDAYDLMPERFKHPSIKAHFNAFPWTHRSNIGSLCYTRAIWLANYIGYQPTIDFDANLLLSRFAYDLNISKHFLSRARIIIRLSKVLSAVFRFAPAEAERTSRPNTHIFTPPEVAIVATLIVAMKLVLGLDDHCEYIMSELADEANGTDPSARHFSFCRWQLQCRMRSAVVEGQAIEQVLSRHWIDHRETWTHSIVTEIKRHRENVHVKLSANSALPKAYDIDPDGSDGDEDGDENGAKAPKQQNKSVMDIDGLRKLFESVTPFRPSTGQPPIECRQLLHPFQETAQLQPIHESDAVTKKLDPNSVKIFEHDFFGDTLSFLDDQSMQERIEQMLRDLSNTAEERAPLNAFEKLFPCARSVAGTGRLLVDAELNYHLRISNMMENETAFEISSTLACLLKMCKIRLEEDTWMLFRAVQRIEASLLAEGGAALAHSQCRWSHITSAMLKPI